MPSAQRLSQNAISGKKQQSISNFFTKDSSATKIPIVLTPDAKNAAEAQIIDRLTPNASDSQTIGGITPESNDATLFFTSDDDEPTFQRPLSRSPKRLVDEVAVEEQRQEGPLRKKARKRNTQQQLLDPKSAHSQATETTLISIPANEVKKPKNSGRTSKYLFSSSPPQAEENLDVGKDAQKLKAKLHESFVKKLGRPDSIADIKRRKWKITEESEGNEHEAEADEEMQEDEATTKPAPKGRKVVASKRAASKLTPMEKQVLEIKGKNLDTLLVVEVGYKFRFFGEDARVAAKELGIVCIPGKFRYDEHPSEAHLDRFASASIPVHRLHVHVKRLVAAGHKVGIVRQLETAALKAAGDNRNAPFVRRLTNLYTKGTYIDDVEGLEGPVPGPSATAPATGYLLCITENSAKGWGTDEKVHVGIVAVQPATGDVVYDDFEDGFMRSEIETRLLHLAPCEFLVVGELSKATEKLVLHLSASKTNVFGDKARVERLEKPKTMAAQAYSHVTNFYASKMKASNCIEDEESSALLDKVLKLVENVTICLSAMITHMSDYGLEHVFDLTKYFQSFSARSHMLLNGTTLTSLEIYQNQTDHSQKGSLFWTLDRTHTQFGRRLLRKWVGRPLLDKAKLEERIAAVEELKDGERTNYVDRVKQLLSKIKSDLEKSLIRIYYGKVSERL